MSTFMSTSEETYEQVFVDRMFYWLNVWNPVTCPCLIVRFDYSTAAWLRSPPLIRHFIVSLQDSESLPSGPVFLWEHPPC